jgi:hypothetical protein
MPLFSFARNVSTLGSSQYAAAVSALISKGHAPAGYATGRDIKVSIEHPAGQATVRNRGSQKAKPGPNGRGGFGIWFRATRWPRGISTMTTQVSDRKLSKLVPA